MFLLSRWQLLSYGCYCVAYRFMCVRLRAHPPTIHASARLLTCQRQSCLIANLHGHFPLISSLYFLPIYGCCLLLRRWRRLWSVQSSSQHSSPLMYPIFFWSIQSSSSLIRNALQTYAWHPHFLTQTKCLHFERPVYRVTFPLIIEGTAEAAASRYGAVAFSSFICAGWAGNSPGLPQ